MATKQRWTWYHLVVFVLTFCSYAFFHATRKAFSNVKDVLQKEWSPYNRSYPLKPVNLWEKEHFFEEEKSAEVFLGVLDTTFLASYAVGLYISGAIGDRFDLTKVLSFGMCSSAVMVFMFGTVSKWIKVYNVWYYGIFMALNGLFQSTGWPSTVAIMGNWFGKSSRGMVFGLWSACASVGNIIGALEVASVLDYGYEYAMLIPSFVLFLGGIMVYFCLIPSPSDIGLPGVDEEEPVVTRPVFNESTEDSLRHSSPFTLPETLFQSTGSTGTTNSQHSKTAVGFCRAILLPGVIAYSLAYACLKLVNYSFFFWLPYYLSNNFGWADTISDELSTFYDIGGIIGGTIAGLATDHMRSRTPVVVGMLIGAVPTLFIYGNAGGGYKTNAGLMAFTGFMIGGPANLISSAISADLGRQNSLKDNAEALATVTGIVDGTGSVGAAIGQVVVPEINTHLNWKYVFYFLMIMTFLSFVCIIIPVFMRLYRRHRNKEPSYQPIITDSDQYPSKLTVNSLANS